MTAISTPRSRIAYCWYSCHRSCRSKPHRPGGIELSFFPSTEAPKTPPWGAGLLRDDSHGLERGAPGHRGSESLATGLLGHFLAVLAGGGRAVAPARLWRSA